MSEQKPIYAHAGVPEMVNDVHESLAAGTLEVRHDIRHTLTVTRAEVAEALFHLGREVPDNCYLTTNGSTLIVEWTERRDD